MFKMRPIPLLALAALIVTSTAWAQGPPSREQREQQAARHMEELRTRPQQPSEEQERQIEPILEKGRRKGRELHEKLRKQERSRSSMQTARDEMQKLHQEVRDQLMPILTTEQLAEFDAVHEEWRAERREQRGEHPGGSGKRSPI